MRCAIVSDGISIFNRDSKERKRLEAAANFIQAETGKMCKVEDTLFDVGQNWAYTTVLMESGMTTFPFFQALEPKQQKMIVYGSSAEWMEAVQEIISKQTKKG